MEEGGGGAEEEEREKGSDLKRSSPIEVVGAEVFVD